MSDLVPARYFSAEHAIEALYRDVNLEGTPLESRVGGTFELQDVVFTLDLPSLCAPASRPKFNVGLGLTHAAEMIIGEDLNEILTLFAPRYSDFSDGYGTYGPRVRDQLAPLMRELVDKPETRRAVLSMWDAGRDMVDSEHGLQHTDHPCTLGITFRIRGGNLYSSVHMRSNDVWLGWPHDSVQFGVLHMTIADALNLGYGAMTHKADSMHMYMRDEEAVLNYLEWLRETPYHIRPRVELSGFGYTDTLAPLEDPLENARSEVRDIVKASSSAADMVAHLNINGLSMSKSGLLWAQAILDKRISDEADSDLADAL